MFVNAMPAMFAALLGVVSPFTGNQADRSGAPIGRILQQGSTGSSDAELNDAIGFIADSLRDQGDVEVETKTARPYELEVTNHRLAIVGRTARCVLPIQHRITEPDGTQSDSSSSIDLHGISALRVRSADRYSGKTSDDGGGWSKDNTSPVTAVYVVDVEMSYKRAILVFTRKDIAARVAQALKAASSLC